MSGLVRFAGLALLPAIVSAVFIFAQTPQLTLRATDGRLIDLSQRRGRIAVVSFGATWVPKIDRDLVAFQRLADRYAGRGIDFYWVSTNSSTPKEKSYLSDEGLQDFASEVGLRLTILRDPHGKALKTFGLDVLPCVIVLDRVGQVRLKLAGLDPEETEYYDPQRTEFYTNRVYDDVIRRLNQLLK